MKVIDGMMESESLNENESFLLRLVNLKIVIIFAFGGIVFSETNNWII